jgi:hypothetical protein
MGDFLIYRSPAPVQLTILRERPRMAGRSFRSLFTKIVQKKTVCSRNSRVQRHPVVRWSYVGSLALIACVLPGLPGCVTERPRPAIVIEGRQIFAPREFHGRWLREDRPGDELRFQLPPQAAFLVVRAGGPAASGDAAEAYDIRRVIERSDGTVSFRVVPAGRSGLADERHFRLETVAGSPAKLIELFGDGRTIQYRRQN